MYTCGTIVIGRLIFFMASDKIDYIHKKIDDVAETCIRIDKELALSKVAFDNHLKQDESMYAELRRMNDILQENTESLKEHIKRTNLLQDMVIKIDQRLSPVEIEHIKDQAVKTWVYDRLKLIGKAGAAIGAVGAAWLALKPLILSLLSP